MKNSIRRRKSTEAGLGFQIAPMIDVVFVIMLYFMVMAGSVTKENAHVTKLPGSIGDPKDTPPLELAIQIDADGQVSLNDDPLDSPRSAGLPELADQLRLIKSTSEDLTVTIDARSEARYQRIVDVLDAVGLAEIRNVTFTSGGE